MDEGRSHDSEHDDDEEEESSDEEDDESTKYINASQLEVCYLTDIWHWDLFHKLFLLKTLTWKTGQK